MPDQVYSLSVIRVKPDCLVRLLHMLPTGEKFYDSQGGKQLGVWTTETGEMSKVVTLVEWPSLERRMEVLSQRLYNPGAVKYFEECRKCYNSVEVYVCHGDSKMRLKPFSQSLPVWINIIQPLKSEYISTKKLHEMTGRVGRKLEEDSELNAFLHPIFYSTRCLFTIWQMQDGYSWSHFLKSFSSFTSDPDNFQMMEQSYKYFLCRQSLVCCPIPFDRLLPPVEFDNEENEQKQMGKIHHEAKKPDWDDLFVKTPPKSPVQTDAAFVDSALWPVESSRVVETDDEPVELPVESALLLTPADLSVEVTVEGEKLAEKLLESDNLPPTEISLAFGCSGIQSPSVGSASVSPVGLEVDWPEESDI